MTISYPLSTPTTIGIETVKLTANTSVVVSQSPFTGEQQILKYPKETWSASITIPPTRRDVAESWVSFLVALKGSYGTFLLGDPNCRIPQGTASYDIGTPVVDGASQTGSSLNIRGLPASAYTYLKAGDYIQLGSGSSSTLHKVLLDVTADSSGKATLELFPSIRTASADGATVTILDPKGNFRLNGNATQWSIGNNSVYGISFDAIEAL